MLTCGVFSDVRGNIVALHAVLSFLMERGVDRLVCLGNLVGQCAYPNECVSLLESLSIAGVVGNHDLIALGRRGFEGCDLDEELALRRTRQRLTARSRAYLASLPRTLALGDGIVMIHGGFREIVEDSSVPPSLAANRAVLAARQPGARICLFGNTHAPTLIEVDDGFVRPRDVGPRIDLPAGERTFFLDPGAVDASLTPLPRLARCAVLDAGRDRVEFHALPYDDDRVERWAHREGFRSTLTEAWELRARRAARGAGEAFAAGIRGLIAGT